MLIKEICEIKRENDIQRELCFAMKTYFQNDSNFMRSAKLYFLITHS